MPLKIIAETAKEFQEIERKLLLLKESVLSQINIAENGIMGLVLTISPIFTNPVKIVVPNSFTQMCDFGSYIGFYCGGFFIKYIKTESHASITLIRL